VHVQQLPDGRFSAVSVLVHDHAINLPKFWWEGFLLFLYYIYTPGSHFVRYCNRCNLKEGLNLRILWQVYCDFGTGIAPKFLRFLFFTASKWLTKFIVALLSVYYKCEPNLDLFDWHISLFILCWKVRCSFAFSYPYSITIVWACYSKIC
jgi:hypothetical protein